MADQFIAVREAAQTLGVSEKKIMDLVDCGDLRAYRIAGQFLRLKKNEVLGIRDSGKVTEEIAQYKYTAGERFADFIYYNDFYIISTLVIFALLYIIFYIQ